LREEIQAEALTRNLEGFSRYFDLLLARSGDFIDFNKFASLAQIERMSAKRYFDILVDTMVAMPVEAFAKSAKRRLIQHPKFYFFDVGVLNGCLGNFTISADRKGILFEHLCLQMITSELKSRDLDFRISVYRTEAGAEVDFIVECEQKIFAIEVKATRTIGAHDLRGLKSFNEYVGKKVESLILYLGEDDLVMHGINIRSIESGILNFVNGLVNR
jgi:predicted AAA+ superfamily ATPase